MKAKIENGILYVEAPLVSNPPRSKSGKTKVPFSTSGFIQLKDENGKDHSLSINLITKD